LGNWTLLCIQPRACKGSVNSNQGSKGKGKGAPTRAKDRGKTGREQTLRSRRGSGIHRKLRVKCHNTKRPRTSEKEQHKSAWTQEMLTQSSHVMRRSPANKAQPHTSWKSPRIAPRPSAGISQKENSRKVISERKQPRHQS